MIGWLTVGTGSFTVDPSRDGLLIRTRHMARNKSTRYMTHDT